jgi:hypothetical protein
MDAIPFDNMWTADRIWLPGALKGKFSKQLFVYDDKKVAFSRAL